MQNEIVSFMHCSKCIAEINSGEAGEVSPADYARLEVGWTEPGLQVWCRRHDLNVLHINFEGVQHPAA